MAATLYAFYPYSTSFIVLALLFFITILPVVLCMPAARNNPRMPSLENGD